MLSKLIDGELNPDEARRLNEFLRGDPAACDLYLNHVTLHAQLERELGGELPEWGRTGVRDAKAAERLCRSRARIVPLGEEIKRRFLRPWPLALAASFALLAADCLSGVAESNQRERGGAGAARAQDARRRAGPLLPHRNQT